DWARLPSSFVGPYSTHPAEGAVTAQTTVTPSAVGFCSTGGLSRRNGASAESRSVIAVAGLPAGASTPLASAANVGSPASAGDNAPANVVIRNCLRSICFHSKHEQPEPAGARIWLKCVTAGRPLCSAQL